MPYDIIKQRGLYYVQNSETKKVKNSKGYKTRQQAIQYQRALYAAENSANKEKKAG
jgi:hypothetical protein